MATPVPPSQWARVPLFPPSGHAEEEAQARRLRDDLRKRWREAAAAAPRVRALKAHIEGELLPSMDRDVAEAVGQLEAAKARMLLKIVARDQHNRVATQPDGTPVLFHLEEDEANDEDVVDAKRRLRRVRAGRDNLLAHLARCNEHLSFVEHQRPPED